MYILPAKDYKFFEKTFLKFKNKSSDFLFNKIKKKIKWLNIKYGEFLIFNQSLPHGNVVNVEKESRISMNCRFKGLYTPYGSKNIGDFFDTRGMFIVKNLDDITNVCNSITTENYHQMLPYIQENYERSFKYAKFRESLRDKIIDFVKNH